MEKVFTPLQGSWRRRARFSVPDMCKHIIIFIPIFSNDLTLYFLFVRGTMSINICGGGGNFETVVCVSCHHV